MTLNTRARRQKWLQDSGLEVMVWSPQSADLDPIEHLWHHLKTRLGDYERPASGIAEFWESTEGVGGYSSICVSESHIKYA